jgi:hypothetical protein
MADRATLTRLGDSPSVMEKGSQELEDSLAVERKKLKGRQAKRFLMFGLAILLLLFGLKAVLGKATPQAAPALQPAAKSVLESWPSKPKEVPVPKAAAPKAATPKVAGKAEHHHAGAAGALKAAAGAPKAATPKAAAGAPKAAAPKAAGKEAPNENKEGKGAGGAKEAKAGGQGGGAASKEAALSARTNPMRRDR